MAEKIERHLREEKNIESEVAGRFGVFWKNLQEFGRHPITGRGFLKQTRYPEDMKPIEEDGERPWQNLNSWTDLLVRFGGIGFLVFAAWYVKSISAFLKNNGAPPASVIMVMGTLLIMLSSQPILVTPAFLSLLYFGRRVKLHDEFVIPDKPLLPSLRRKTELGKYSNCPTPKIADKVG